MSDGDIAEVHESLENMDIENAVKNQFGISYAETFDNSTEAKEFIESVKDEGLIVAFNETANGTYVVALDPENKTNAEILNTLEEALDNFNDRNHLTSYDVNIFDNLGNIQDGQTDILAENEEAALAPAGEISMYLGSYDSYDDLIEAEGYNMEFYQDQSIQDILSLADKKQDIIANDEITVSTTGHDYDFIAYVENKTDHDISISFSEVGNTGYQPEDITIPAQDWVGLEANLDDYATLAAFHEGSHEIEIEDSLDDKVEMAEQVSGQEPSQSEAAIDLDAR